MVNHPNRSKRAQLAARRAAAERQGFQAPAKCPKCGCEKIEMQVYAWGVFERGKFQILNEAPGIMPLDDAIAVCDACDHEWHWEQIP